MRSLSTYLKTDRVRTLRDYFRSREMQIVYLISLLAMLGSLSVSEVYGWTPFTLSTLQRVFMYPIVLTSGLGIVLKSRSLYTASVFLAVPGMVASGTHFYTLRTSTMIGCGYALPCTTESRIVLFGRGLWPSYLPLMALIVFAAVTVVVLSSRENLELLIKNLNEIRKSWIQYPQ